MSNDNTNNPFGNMNLGDLLNKAQEFQKSMMEQNEEAAKKTYEASSGGGMVKATVNGAQELLSVQIEDEVINKEEKTMLEDLVCAAVNEALKKSAEDKKDVMKDMMGKMNIPGMPNLF